MKENLLDLVRQGRQMTFMQQLWLTVSLSMPAMLSQISTIVMEYIDASMVGSLGANASASIGLVASTIWLFGGLCSAVTTGFAVQVAHRIGASDNVSARSVLRQAIVSGLAFSALLGLVGVCISSRLPYWLGGGEEIASDATAYFLIFSATMPLMELYFLSAAMLRSSGNMVVPSALNVAACALDVLMNFFFIFPTRIIDLGGISFTMPGLGMGVIGAALGSAAAFLISTSLMMGYLCLRSKELRLTHEKGRFIPQRATLHRAVGIGTPMMLQHFVMCSAQIMTTVIVAPLGTIAIAAHSFGITAESLCYMPGIGVSDAATTLIGQSMGAGRKDLMRRFAFITVGMGILVMSLMGIVMYVFAPLMMEILTPVAAVQELGIACLRIEAWAEPMFAASIVTYGVFVGTGKTMIPSVMNFGSIWGVRVVLAAILASLYGLQGVWAAMCIELMFRGIIFLARLWLKRENLGE